MDSSGEVVDSETLGIFVSKLLSSPLPLDKPCWSMHVIEKLKSRKGKSAIVFRIHHAVADGYTLLRQMLLRMGSGVESKSIYSVQGKKGTKSLVSSFSLMAKAGFRVIMRTADPANEIRLSQARSPADELKFFTTNFGGITVSELRSLKAKIHCRFAHLCHRSTILRGASQLQVTGRWCRL